MDTNHVLHWISICLPRPGANVAMPLIEIDRDLIAEVAAEIHQQGNRCQGEQGDMACVLHVHSWRKELVYLVVNQLDGTGDVGQIIAVQRSQVDDVAAIVAWIPGCHGFCYLCNRNVY